MLAGEQPKPCAAPTVVAAAPVTRPAPTAAEVQAALARKGTPAALWNDEVTLSHAVSRGVLTSGEAWTRLAAEPGVLPDGWAHDAQLESQALADGTADAAVDDTVHDSLMLVLPAKDKNSLAGFVPVLMDNGASWEVHCNRTLDGAILDSYQPNLSELTVGKKGSGLAS